MSFTIGKKLFLGVGTLVIFTFALGFTALYTISSLGDNLRDIVSKTMRKAVIAGQIDTQASELLSAERGMTVRGYMKDQNKVQKYHADFIKTANDLQANLDTMKLLVFLPDGKAALQQIEECLPSMRTTNDDVYRLVSAGDMDGAAKAYSDVIVPTLAREKAAVATLIKIQSGLLATSAETAENSVHTGQWITTLCLILTCCVAIAVIFVVRQINTLLRHSVLEMSESAVQIAAAASQVAASSQSLAQGSSEQAATIEETSSASAEINSMARRNTDNSQSTAEIVTRSQEGYDRTNQSLVEMVNAMDNINASSQKISKIIKVIDEIAFQTNILALNAAVEAARAGEAGMGFAVVADEVRNLAQRCAQAAKDTADLIEESIQNANGGRLKVDQVALSIRAITAESAKIKILVDEINLGSVEQSRGIDQISRSVTQMEQVTQSSAANAEESAAAAEELSSQAETLNQIVNALRVMVDGASPTSNNPSSYTRSPFQYAAA